MSAKPFIGVVHLPPSPSARREDLPVEAGLSKAMADAQALAAGGVDGIMIENFGDAPFHKGGKDDPVPPDVVAWLALAAREVRIATGLPVGINCLRNDGVGAVGAAVIAGARWVRVNVLTGTALTDQGVIEGEATRIRDYARQVGFTGTLLADLMVKHSVPLAPLDPVVAARDLAERSGASGMILTGARTGMPVDEQLLRLVRSAVDTFPIWLGSGLDVATARDLWPLCDGAIVGTSLKRDGHIHQPVDVERVRSLRKLLV